MCCYCDKDTQESFAPVYIIGTYATLLLIIGGGLLIGYGVFPDQETFILTNKSYVSYQHPNCGLTSDLQYYNIFYDFIKNGTNNNIRACQGVYVSTPYYCCANTGTSKQFCYYVDITNYDEKCSPLISDSLDKYNEMIIGKKYTLWNNKGSISLNKKKYSFSEKFYIFLIVVSGILYLISIIILVPEIYFCLKCSRQCRKQNIIATKGYGTI